MSADLFAEFGNGPSTRQPSNAARQHAPAPQASSLIDGLDAFEDATLAQSTPRHLNEPAPLSGTRKHSIQYDDFGEFELPQPGTNNDVLFDAALEEFSDDASDDWGEFETAEPSIGHINKYKAEQPVERQETINKPAASTLQNTRSPSGLSGTVDLLDSLDSLSFQDKPTASYHRSTDILVDDSPATKIVNMQNAKPKLPVQEELFEEWADFTDGPIETTQSSNRKVADHQGMVGTKGDPAQTLKPTAKIGPTKVLKPRTKSPPAGHVRPTNIPPPSILLELFPQIFERLRQDGAEAKRNLQEREILESVSLSIINTLKTVARVIAGRTLRWKRDAILSQSMRIGPARSGKTGGMKLSTVNKNEDIKEQQEAVDVINMWRDRAALFNSVTQAAGRRPVQAIMENTRVTTAMASHGAIKASHACALCGLKRDERIPKIDENVEDSFGEWWTEHWGHTECRQFWEDNMGLLGQR